MRAAKTSQEAFVKRLANSFNLGVIRLGLARYTGPLTYRDYEQYLNGQYPPTGDSPLHYRTGAVATQYTGHFLPRGEPAGVHFSAKQRQRRRRKSK